MRDCDITKAPSQREIAGSAIGYSRRSGGDGDARRGCTIGITSSTCGPNSDVVGICARGVQGPAVIPASVHPTSALA